MAGKNQVVLTFSGDSSSLERSLDRVGSSAKDMGDNVGDASNGFDRVGESADGAETRMTGLASGIDGVTSLMDDPSPQEFAQGLADIADGAANFLIPTLKSAATQIATTGSAALTAAAQHVSAAATTVAGWIAMGVQSTINAAKMAAAWLIGLGPIGLVIAGIAAVIAILVALGVDFEDVKEAIGKAWEFIKNAAMSAFNWLKTNWPLVLAIITGPIGLAVLAVTRNWETIKNGFTAVKNWIRDRANDIVSFIKGIPERIAGAAASIGSTIINGIKDGVASVTGFVGDIGSAIKGAINDALHLPFTINGPGPLPDFTIPAFHSGGTFRAPRGEREGLALLLDGERVLRPGAGGDGGPGVTIIVNAPLISSETELMRMIDDHFRRGGFGGIGL